MGKTMIEVVLNEGTPRSANPNVPFTPDEVGSQGSECARNGGTILHFHARTADGSQAPSDAEHYAKAVGHWTELDDFLWYPPQGGGVNAPARWRHVEELVKRETSGLELITIDPGSLDFMFYDPQTQQVTIPQFAAEMEADEVGTQGEPMTGVEQWMWFCESSLRLGLKPVFGIMEPGYLRRVLSFVHMGLVEEPLILHLFFTDRWNFGLPPRAESIETYLGMIPDGMAREWILCTIGVPNKRRRELQRYAIENGGHIRVGLGEPPLEGYGEDTPTNGEVVAEAAEFVESLGGSVATPGDARKIMGVGQ